MNSSAGYGNHPTVYSSLSNDALFTLYTGGNWAGLNENARQQLLQETVNRAAAQNGEIGACEVRFASLPGTVLGQQSGNIIELNRSVFVEDKYVHDYNGTIIEEPAPDSNFLALETALHEDVHAWQNQCTDGTIVCPDRGLEEEYRANNFTVSYVQGSDGRGHPGSHYLNGKDPVLGYYIYYFQSSERDAHYFSQRQTGIIGNFLQEKHGVDPSFQEYLKNLAVNGYAAVHQKGAEQFANPNFDKEINTVLMNQYYGTSLSVDPTIEKAVKEDMIASYYAQVKHSNSAENFLQQKNTGLSQKHGEEPVVFQQGADERGGAVHAAADISEKAEAGMKAGTGVETGETVAPGPGIGDDEGGIE